MFIFIFKYGHALFADSIILEISQVLSLLITSLNSSEIRLGFFLISFDRIKQAKVKSHKFFFGGFCRATSSNSIL